MTGTVIPQARNEFMSALLVTSSTARSPVRSVRSLLVAMPGAPFIAFLFLHVYEFMSAHLHSMRAAQKPNSVYA